MSDSNKKYASCTKKLAKYIAIGLVAMVVLVVIAALAIEIYYTRATGPGNNNLYYLVSTLDKLVIGSIACIISLVILYLTIKLCKNSQKSVCFNYIDFEKNIDEIINSRFSTVLERSVPKGEGDSNLGLDYIPFLLENTGRRKRKFKKRADKLLIACTVLGAIFALVIIAYGYIVINSSFDKDDADIIKNMQEYLEENEELRDIIENEKGINKIINDFESDIKNKDISLEFIKIISVGLMLAGFFIGILKYFFNIYISNFNQMLMADKEEMQIRKYYVAYKGSKTDEERKAAVLRFLEPTISQEKPGN